VFSCADYAIVFLILCTDIPTVKTEGYDCVL